jgi:large subunit ribosomal protein L11
MAKKTLARNRQDPDPGRAGDAGAAGRYRARPHGINIMDFCKAYNARRRTSAALVIPAEITIFEDRSFTFVTKTPPTPFLLRQAAGVEKGAQNARTEQARTVTQARCARSPRRRCPTSTPSTSTARCPGRGHRPLDGHRVVD